MRFGAAAAIVNRAAVIRECAAVQPSGGAGRGCLTEAGSVDTGEPRPTIVIRATLAGCETDSVANDLAGRATELFGIAGSETTGVVTALAVRSAAIGPAGDRAAGADALRAAGNRGVWAVERFGSGCRPAGGIGSGRSTETCQGSSRDGGALQERPPRGVDGKFSGNIVEAVSVHPRRLQHEREGDAAWAGTRPDANCTCFLFRA